MSDVAQIMERYRHLSRDIQNSLQLAQKKIDNLKSQNKSSDLLEIENSIFQACEAWNDFSGWMLLCSLDEISEARSNCALGIIDIQSKVKRSVSRRKNETNSKGLNIDFRDVSNIQIDTYIPYFEQFLDLIIANAVKYSPRGSSIYISTENTNSGVKLMIQSTGPLVHKHEEARLGEKGFRAENAKKISVTGQGYGLYNVKRLSELLDIEISLRPNNRISYSYDNIPYADFVVVALLPERPDSSSFR